MSFIDAEHQRTLRAYGVQAEALYRAGNEQELARWLQQLQEREQTWAAIVDPQLSAIAGSELSERFRREFSLGRDRPGRFICTSRTTRSWMCPSATGIFAF